MSLSKETDLVRFDMSNTWRGGGEAGENPTDSDTGNLLAPKVEWQAGEAMSRLASRLRLSGRAGLTVEDRYRSGRGPYSGRSPYSGRCLLRADSRFLR